MVSSSKHGRVGGEAMAASYYTVKSWQPRILWHKREELEIVKN